MYLTTTKKAEVFVLSTMLTTQIHSHLPAKEAKLVVGKVPTDVSSKPQVNFFLELYPYLCRGTFKFKR